RPYDEIAFWLRCSVNDAKTYFAQVWSLAGGAVDAADIATALRQLPRVRVGKGSAAAVARYINLRRNQSSSKKKKKKDNVGLRLEIVSTSPSHGLAIETTDLRRLLPTSQPIPLTWE